MKYLFSFSLFFLTLSVFGQTRILVDGKFEDWSAYPISYTDNKGDAGSSGIDFGELQISNDDDYLFLLLETTAEINLQDQNNVSIYLDTDGNVNSGLFINGIGADLVYNFGNRQGIFYESNNSYEIYHSDINLITAPTVTSDRFEIAIRRDITIAGKSLFKSDQIKVVFKDDISTGDFIPNINDHVDYDFLSVEQESLPTYSIDKSNTSDLRIVSYNALFDGLFDQSRLPAFSRIFIAVKPDIIGFQEIYDYSSAQVANQMETILPSSGGEQWYHAKQGPDCHAISRYPIIESAFIPGYNGNAGNGAFLIDIPNLETNLLLIVAHPPCCSNNTGRQTEVDLIMEFLREAKAGNGPMPIEANTPIVILGDMNFVGYRRQVETLLTGNIANEAAYGEDFNPDWNGEDLIDSHPYTTGLPFSMSWYDEGSSFSPGRLDYLIYSGSNLELQNNYALFTPALPQDSLNAFNLFKNDVLIASDHLPLVADFQLKISSANQDIIPKNTNGIYVIHPNPSSGITQLSIFIGRPDLVSIQIMDANGIVIKTLFNEILENGDHKMQFDLSVLPAGAYYIKMTSAESSATKKMIILH